MAIAQRLLCVFLLLSAPCDGAKKYRRTPKQKPVAPPPPSAPLRAPPPAPEPRPPEAPPIEFNDDTRITDEETVEEYSKEYLEKEKIKKQASHFATQQLADIMNIQVSERTYDEDTRNEVEYMREEEAQFCGALDQRTQDAEEQSAFLKTTPQQEDLSYRVNMCAICQAVTYRGAIALAAALANETARRNASALVKARRAPQPVPYGLVVLQTLELTCSDRASWRGYEILPQKAQQGLVFMIRGDGIDSAWAPPPPPRRGAYARHVKKSTEELEQELHRQLRADAEWAGGGEEVASRLDKECHALLLSSDPDEEEILTILADATRAGANQTAALRARVCDRPGQACAVSEEARRAVPRRPGGRLEPWSDDLKRPLKLQ